MPAPAPSPWPPQLNPPVPLLMMLLMALLRRRRGRHRCRGHRCRRHSRHPSWYFVEANGRPFEWRNYGRDRSKILDNPSFKLDNPQDNLDNTRVRTPQDKQGQKIRQFILEQVDEHPHDITQHTAKNFTLTRQAVNIHLQRMVADGRLVRRGKTRKTRFFLAPIKTWRKHYSGQESESDVWESDILKRKSQICLKTHWTFGVIVLRRCLTTPSTIHPGHASPWS